ncbi:MAG: transporter substrate-binding domain-containing protein [Acidimicrobiales bacterium]
MIASIRACGRVVIAVAVGLTLLTASSAGATQRRSGFNAYDASLVPVAYRHVTLKVATDATYPPDEWMKGPKMVGLDVDMLRAVATTLGISIQENNVIFGDIVTGLTSGKYEIGNSSFTDTRASERQMNFVDYFRAGEGFLVRHGDTASFKQLSNLCGQVVAVEQNSIEQADAANEAKKCAPKHQLTLKAYPTMSTTGSAVLSGRANVGFLDSQVAGYLALTSKGKLTLARGMLNVVTFGFATAKTSLGRRLAIAIRAALKTLITEGTYQKILRQWGSSNGALSRVQVRINGARSSVPH